MKSGEPKTNNDLVIIPLTCFVDGRGSLTPVERKMLSFDISRVYFVHGVDHDTIRGDHGHYRTNQVFIAVEGKIVVECYDGHVKRKFALSTSENGLFVPAGIWTTNHHSKGSVMCVLADRPYNERDYIEDRSIFKRWKRCQPFFGTFKSFGDVEKNDSLDNNDWLDYQLEELEGITDDADEELINVLSDSMVILDFGGSLGHSYFKVLNSTHFDSLEYHVVETQMMVDAGRKVFSAHPRLLFHDHIPRLPVVDIVYSRTALQYVDNWRDVLKRLVSLDAEYIILSDTQAGNIKTFVGIQNWYGHLVPNWFFSIKELLEAIPGYDLTMLTPGMPINMTNYRKEQRLTHACNLVLKRRKS